MKSTVMTVAALLFAGNAYAQVDEVAVPGPVDWHIAPLTDQLGRRLPGDRMQDTNGGWLMSGDGVRLFNADASMGTLLDRSKMTPEASPDPWSAEVFLVFNVSWDGTIDWRSGVRVLQSGLVVLVSSSMFLHRGFNYGIWDYEGSLLRTGDCPLQPNNPGAREPFCFLDPFNPDPWARPVAIYSYQELTPRECRAVLPCGGGGKVEIPIPRPGKGISLGANADLGTAECEAKPGEGKVVRALCETYVAQKRVKCHGWDSKNRLVYLDEAACKM